MEKLTSYIKDIYVELTEKTSWPTFAELRRESLIVLIASLVFSLTIWLMDSGFTRIMDFIYSL